MASATTINAKSQAQGDGELNLTAALAAPLPVAPAALLDRHGNGLARAGTRRRSPDGARRHRAHRRTGHLRHAVQLERDGGPRGHGVELVGRHLERLHLERFELVGLQLAREHLVGVELVCFELVGVELEREHAGADRAGARAAGRARPGAARAGPAAAGRARPGVDVREFRLRMGGRALLVAALVAVSAASFASPSHAASGIKYGIQDDAWLEFGPGKLNDRVATLKRLGVPLVRFTRPLERGRAEAAGGSSVAARPRVRLEPLRPCSVLGLRRHGLTPVVTLVGTPAWANERARPELRPAAAARLPRVRARGRVALPMGALLADLERAEPPALAQADEGVDLRRASAQPRLRGDPLGAAACTRRRRCDRAARRARRRRARYLASRHGSGTREARCLRPQSVSAPAGRDAVGSRLPLLPERSRWRRCRSC